MHFLVEGASRTAGLQTSQLQHHAGILIQHHHHLSLRLLYLLLLQIAHTLGAFAICGASVHTRRIVRAAGYCIPQNTQLRVEVS